MDLIACDQLDGLFGGEWLVVKASGSCGAFDEEVLVGFEDEVSLMFCDGFVRKREVAGGEAANASGGLVEEDVFGI